MLEQAVCIQVYIYIHTFLLVDLAAYTSRVIICMHVPCTSMYVCIYSRVDGVEYSTLLYTGVIDTSMDPTAQGKHDMT